MMHQNTKKSPGIEFVVFNCTRGMGMDDFDSLNFLILFYFYLVTNLWKKLMTYAHLQLNLPLPPYESAHF